MDDRKKTALITGASSGIGYELSKLFAQDNYNLVIISRNKEKLEKTASEFENKYNIYVEVIPKDLAKSSSPDELLTAVKSKNIGIDVLVNNAGFATHGKFLESSLQEELDMLQVNIVSLTHLSKIFGREMSLRGGGKILNIASTAAFLPGPLMAVYYATKAYVLSFSEALSNELKESNITVTALCPGPTDTHFQDRAGISKSKLMSRNIMTAAEVAKEGYQALKADRSIYIPGVRNKIIALGTRLVPGSISAGIARKVQEMK
jgi:short-subunit dehydrogenase